MLGNPLGIGNRIYFFGKDGHTTVIAAGEKFEVMAENQLWEPTEAAARGVVRVDRFP